MYLLPSAQPLVCVPQQALYRGPLPQPQKRQDYQDDNDQADDVDDVVHEIILCVMCDLLFFIVTLLVLARTFCTVAHKKV